MKIAKATERSGRSLDQIRMVAVSKNQPVSMIQEAIQAGITDLGENRVQDSGVINLSNNLAKLKNLRFLGLYLSYSKISG